MKKVWKTKEQNHRILFFSFSFCFIPILLRRFLQAKSRKTNNGKYYNESSQKISSLKEPWWKYSPGDIFAIQQREIKH